MPAIGKHTENFVLRVEGIKCYNNPMTFLEAILLGILQGLTEFLPVSSSGHLVLAQQFLGLQEPLVFFDVMLHVGTLAAVLVAYRDAIKRLVIGGLSTLGDTQFWRQPRCNAQYFRRTQVYRVDTARLYSDRYYRRPVQDTIRIPFR